MKKIISITVLGLLLIGNAYSAPRAGKGELVLSDDTLNRFIKYIQGKGRQTPAWFYVTLDGNRSIYWSCGSGDCQMRDNVSQICEVEIGQECKLFATRRTIRWKNDINPGKGKASTFKSKWSESEIIAKLNELGFLGGSTTVSKLKKIEKTIDQNKNDIVGQLKTINELYKSGSLTKEEFAKAKKKLLN